MLKKGINDTGEKVDELPVVRDGCTREERHIIRDIWEISNKGNEQ